MPLGEGQGRCEEPGSAAPKDSPAYGAWNVQKGATGTGEALPGPLGERLAERAGPITGEEPGSGQAAGRESEAVIVPIEPLDNKTDGEGKGRCFVHAWRTRRLVSAGRLGPQGGMTTPKPSARRTHALPYGQGGSRMPAVKDVGEPCAGEPHARFDGGELEKEQPRRHREERLRETKGIAPGRLSLRPRQLSTLQGGSVGHGGRRGTGRGRRFAKARLLRCRSMRGSDDVARLGKCVPMSGPRALPPVGVVRPEIRRLSIE